MYASAVKIQPELVHHQAQLASEAEIEIGNGRVIDIDFANPISPITALPAELIIALLQQVEDPTSTLNLTTTCQAFHLIYQENLPLYKRQEHVFLHNLNTPSLCEKFYALLAKSNIVPVEVPLIGTEEWKALKDQPLTDDLATRVKKIYIDAWALLLQPQSTSRLQAAELLRLLLNLSPYIHNAPDYADSLLASGLSWRMLYQFKDVHLDRCLQLVLKHFPIPEETTVRPPYRVHPTYKFIFTCLPPEAITLREIRKIQSNQYRTFLFYAIKNRVDMYMPQAHERYATSLALFKALLEQGCDLEQTNQEGDTALICLIKRANQVKYQVLVQEEYEYGYPYQQIDQLVSLLLGKGANCNVKDQSGYTPFMLASRYELDTLALLLLRQPTIDINARDNKGNHALHFAVSSRYLSQLLDHLLQHPELSDNVNAKNNAGESILDKIALSRDLTNIQKLLRYSHTKIHESKYADLWALYQAIEYDKLSQLQDLLSVEAKFEIRVAAFSYAIWQKKEEIIHLFLNTMDAATARDMAHQAFNRLFSIPQKYRQDIFALIEKKYASPSQSREN
jgi:ankyrin repeat protein